MMLEKLSRAFAAARAAYAGGETRADGGSSGSPAGWVVGALGGRATASGVRISPATAMCNTAVYASVRVTAEDVAKLPVDIFELRTDGSRAVAKHHSVRRLLQQPNSWQTSFEWREMMQAHVELRGNAYAWKKRSDDGQVSELIPLHPDRVQMRVTTDGEIFYFTNRASCGISPPEIVAREDMVHIRGQSLDGFIGVSPISYIRESIGISSAAEQYGAAFFGNGARPDYFISPKTRLTPDSAKAIRERINERHQGAGKSHKPEVMPVEIDIKTIGVSNRDSQFIQLRGFQVADIARAFRIPPHKIGDLSNATFSNIEEQALEYYIDGLMPRLERFEAALERDLLTAEEREKFEIEVDFSNILRGDIDTMMKAIASGRQWGLLSANEGRAWLNLDPIPGGDTYLTPLNMDEMTPSSKKQKRAMIRKLMQHSRGGEIVDLDDVRKSRDAIDFLRRSIANSRQAA